MAFISVTVTEEKWKLPYIFDFTLPLLWSPPLAPILIALSPPSDFSVVFGSGQGVNDFVLSHRIPDLQFDLFSINVDHTGPKLHTCQWRPREKNVVVMNSHVEWEVHAIFQCASDSSSVCTQCHYLSQLVFCFLKFNFFSRIKSCVLGDNDFKNATKKQIWG